MIDGQGGRTTTAPQVLDPSSRAWLEDLSEPGPRRRSALRRLHALLLREAGFQVRRHARALKHPSGRDLDDLALQAADDALVAIIAKLGDFRGEARFTTWASRFVQLEVPGELRRRLGHAHETPVSRQVWEGRPDWRQPQAELEARELTRTIGNLIAEELTPHQREVLIALAIDGVAPSELSKQLHTNPNALYKTLHDAREKLRGGLDAERISS